MGSPYNPGYGYGMPGGMPPPIGMGYGSPFMFPYRSNATVVDAVPQDMLFMVHEHWYNFPPMNPLWHSLLGAAMVVLGIISIVGNGVVIYLMTAVKSLRTPNVCPILPMRKL